MGRVLPILFNSDMVRAILDGRKTVTRRVVKGNVVGILNSPFHNEHPEVPDNVVLEKLCKASYHSWDILYVRETWAFLPCVECMCEGEDCGRPQVMYEDKHRELEGCFVYRADHPQPERVSWAPSIHMPKEAARIWLRVTDVRVERLQDMDTEDGKNYIAEGARDKQDFIKIWDATVKDKERYSWDASPWVWVIEFERCEKPEI